MQQDCQHEKTELIARRDGIEYVRCLLCDHVFEAEDLEPVAVYDEEDSAPA